MLSRCFLSGSRLFASVSGRSVACSGQRREFSSGEMSLAPIQTVAVIGSGLMGSGIAQVSAAMVHVYIIFMEGCALPLYK